MDRLCYLEIIKIPFNRSFTFGSCHDKQYNYYFFI